MRYLLFVLVFTGLCAHANASETWECGDIFKEQKVLIVATANDKRTAGEVQVAGVTHKSRFLVKGFERRWDFGLKNNGEYDYAFIIKPNGDALYYDFSSAKAGEIVTSSMVFRCNQSTK